MSTRIDRKNPFSATVKERYSLTRSGSTKESFHVVLDLKDSGMEFKVGDAIGILAENDPSLVERILKALQVPGNTPIVDPRSKQEMPLGQFLLRRVNLSRLTISLLGASDPDYIATHDL